MMLLLRRQMCLKQPLRFRLIKAAKAKKAALQSTQKPKDDSNTPKFFDFGNFSNLHKLTQRELKYQQALASLVDSFEQLRLFPSVRLAMIEEIRERYNFKNTYLKDKSELVIKPSSIQAAAIKKINQVRKVSKSQVSAVGKKNMSPVYQELMSENEENRVKIFLLSSETGSGKTWAYLASIFSKLKEDDLELFSKSKTDFEESVKARQIRAVVLLPTHELVDQVYATAERAAKLKLDLKDDPSYAKNRLTPEMQSFLEYDLEKNQLLNLNIFKWGTGDPHTKLFDAVRQKRIDVLITTPSKLASLRKVENLTRPYAFFSGVRYCVLDEADTLMDQSWSQDTIFGLSKFPNLRDLIMCAATISRSFEKSFNSLFPNGVARTSIMDTLTHKIPRKIDVKVIDAEQQPFHGSKTKCLAQALYAIYNDGTEGGHVKRVLVFLNQRQDVEPLVDTLIEKYGHRKQDILGITGRDLPEDRALKIEPFVNPATPLEEDLEGSKIKVLITTDVLARGLDFQGIKNVILMDMPKHSVELIHRIGRTGRMKQSGRAFIIMNKKDKSWVKGLPTVVKKGIRLG